MSRKNAGVGRGAKTPTSPCERGSRSTVGRADHHAACDNPDTTVDSYATPWPKPAGDLGGYCMWAAGDV